MAPRAKQLTYQLPGIGRVDFLAFAYAQKMQEWATARSFDLRLQSASQLGYLRNSVLGSHHTRLDYVMAQWAIVSRSIVRADASDMLLEESQRLVVEAGTGLGSPVEEVVKPDDMASQPSGAEVLQCVAMLASLGHLPQTFAASRAWVHTLRTDKAVRRAYLAGFPKERQDGFDLSDREAAERAIDLSNIYSIHNLNTMFVLHRQPSDGTVRMEDYLLDLIRRFLTNTVSAPSHRLMRLRGMHHRVRRMAYIALDSHYGPVPFAVNLQSLLSDPVQLNRAVTRTDDHTTPWIPLEAALRETVYMARWSMYELSKATQHEQENLALLRDANPLGLKAIRKVLEPRPSGDDDPLRRVFNHQYRSTLDGDVFHDGANSVLLTVPLRTPFGRVDPPAVALRDWELTASQAHYNDIAIRVVAEFDPSRDHLKVGAFDERFAHTLDCFLDRSRTAKSMLDFIVPFGKEYASRLLEQASKEGSTPPGDSEKLRRVIERMALVNTIPRSGMEEILRWCLTPAFESGVRFEFVPHATVQRDYPIFYGRGTTALANQIDAYANMYSASLPADAQHEVETVAQVCRERSEKGEVLCFVGQSHLYAVDKKGHEQQVAELDGLVIFVGRKAAPHFLVVEAKDYRTGPVAAAEAQLGNKVARRLAPTFSSDVHPVAGMGAYLEVSGTPS